MLGSATPALAAFYTFAFGVIVLQYRWFLARIGLCITGGLALLVVGLDIVVDVGLTTAMRALIC